MSIVNSVIRPFWVPGLNAINGNQKYSFAQWIIKQDYQIYQLIENNSFILEIADPQSLLSALAFDCNRMASVAFETICLIKQHELLPKSTGWMIIQLYYSAFFAAHSILRMLGLSCSQIEREQAEKVSEIAQLYENDNGLNISGGYYKCVYDNQSKQLSCHNIRSSKGGTHERFWDIFLKRMRELSSNIFESNISSEQIVATKIDEICRNLCHEGKNGGNWLSYVRNNVNYRHELGTWFPYEKIKRKNVDKLYNYLSMWQKDPMDISSVSARGTDIDLFHRTCSFIVSLCRTLVQDMCKRCPKGRSYLADGSIRLLNQTKLSNQEISP